MATGDITSVTVRADGWSADVVIEGFTTGATYNFGLGTNNTPTASTPFLAVVSEGYDDTGALTTITRTVYITHAMRKAYPNYTAKDETGGGNLTVRVALSEPVFVGDNTGAGNSGTAPTATIPAAWCTNTGGASQTSNAYTAGAVTNSSAETYAEVQCIANWAMPAKQLINTASFKFRVAAFQYFGQQGRPVRAVKVEVTDESAHTASAIATAPSIESTEYGDAGPPIVEYIVDLDLSGLDDTEELTCNFTAYPWVGDADAIRTSVGGPAQPTPLAAPIKMVLNRAGGYERRVAVVDSAAADDLSGSTVAYADFNPASPPASWKTVKGAANALDTAMTRSDIGGCIIYLRDNAAHAWTGGTVSASTRKCHVEVATFPLDTRASLTSNSGSQHLGSGFPVKLRDVTIQPAAHSMFGSIDYFWIDECTINDTTIRTWSQCDLLWFTRCTFTRCAQGVGPYSTEATSAALVRGCSLGTAFTDSFIAPFVFVGNITPARITRTAVMIDSDTLTSTGIPNPQNWIVAYNKISTTSGLFMQLGAESRTYTVAGIALVQNLVERTTEGNLSVQSPAGDSRDTRNILIWHNTFADDKHNIFYNDAAGVRPVHEYISAVGNIWHDYNIKSDTFALDGLNVNNWQPLHGVGFHGNLLAETGVGANQQFVASMSASAADGRGFDGLWTNADGKTAPVDPLYVNDQSVDGGAAGGGDYNLTATSPAIGLVQRKLLPYDLAGVARSTIDAAGAYHYGTATSSNFLFFF